MKLGVHIGTGAWASARGQLTIVQEAERLGYDSIWTARGVRVRHRHRARLARWQTLEDPARLGDVPDAGPLGGNDRDDRRTIDQLSDGRMLLGIGSSGPQVAEGWHGQRFAEQLQRTREYVRC